MANTTCYVLDAFDRAVPDEVARKLFIGGRGVAAGSVGHADVVDGSFCAELFGHSRVNSVRRAGCDHLGRRSGPAVGQDTALWS